MSQLDSLEKLLKQLEYQLTYTQESFQLRLMEDYNFDIYPNILVDWHSMDYLEFKAELDVLLSKTLLSSCLVRDWEEYFTLMKRNYHKLKKDIEATRLDINTLKDLN